jgi:hypothetical protein
MPSALRSETARANGAKSRGPRSAATREKSSLNATRHGFTAHNTILLECEDPDLFQNVRTEYLAIYKPETPAEEVLVDEMVVARWRIQRLWTIETALFDREVRRKEKEDHPDSAAKLAQAFQSLADESRSLALLSRYESRLHRMHERSYRTLRQLQQDRQQPPKQDQSESDANVGQVPKPTLVRGSAKQKNESNPSGLKKEPEGRRCNPEATLEEDAQATVGLLLEPRRPVGPAKRPTTAASEGEHRPYETPISQKPKNAAANGATIDK